MYIFNLNLENFVLIGVFRANVVLHGKQGSKRSSGKARHVSFNDIFLYSLHLNFVAVLD